MSPTEPDRWAESGSDAPLALQRLLQNAREDLPGPRTLAALGVAVPTILAESTTTAAAASAKLGAASVAKAGGVAASTKLATALLITLAAGGTYYYAQSSNDSPPSNTRPSASAEAPTDNRSAEEAPSTNDAEPTSAHDVLDVPSSEAASDKATPATRPAEKSNADELPLLQQARSALRRDPSKALALVRRHEQEFPNSRYLQEREVIRIEALRGMGKDDEADRLGEDFNRRFPGSAHKSKLNRESQ